MSTTSTRRRNRHEEHENHERWLVSYADFITLLFAFFTVLYATSQQDTEKAKQFEQSIRKYFGSMMGGAGAAIGESQVFERGRTYIEPPAQTFADSKKGTLEIENFVDKYLKDNLTPEEHARLVKEVGSDAEGVRIRLAGPALFQGTSTAIESTALPALAKIASLLKQTHHSIVIEGHTDSSAPSPLPSNWELSSLRAIKIVRYLIERGGVPAAQISSRAYADQKPVADNSSAEGRTANQRVEILLSNQPAEE